jgi:hypothetical protein
MNQNIQTSSYQTLEEIEQRKDQLHTELQAHSKHIGNLWHDLTVSQPANSKGEIITNIISNSITAIDAFLLVRKLMKTYGKFFGKRKKR